jgi:hypothetical protein
MMRDRVCFGFTQGQLAEKYNMSNQNVSILINSPLWKKEAATMHDAVMGEYQAKVTTLVPKALEAVEEIMQRTQKVTSVDAEGNERYAHVPNPPAARIRASELVLKAVGVVGDKDRGGGNKSVVLNLVQPGWGSEDGKPTAINVEVS